MPQSAPLIELQARSVDAIDALAMLPRLEHRDFVVVRDQHSSEQGGSVLDLARR